MSRRFPDWSASGSWLSTDSWDTGAPDEHSPAARPLPPAEDLENEPMVRLRPPPGHSKTQVNLVLVHPNRWDATRIQQLVTEADSSIRLNWFPNAEEAVLRLAQGGVDALVVYIPREGRGPIPDIAAISADAPRTPIIALTGPDDEATGLRALRAGAQDYLVRGTYDGTGLARAVRRGMERHRFHEERQAAQEWRRELQHLREIDRLRNMFADTASESETRPWVAEAAGLRPKTNEESLAEAVEQLLRIVEIQDGTATLRRERVDLSPLVNELADSVRPAANQSRIDLRVVSPDSVIVEADPLRLIQVLRALLEHAMRSTPPKGSIIFTTKTTDGFGVVEMHFSGVGFGVEQMFSAAHVRAQGNLLPSRLGLVLARHLIELHGGQMWAEREHPGPSTTVTFRVPLRARD
jgi:signal transduction histidine kinase